MKGTPPVPGTSAESSAYGAIANSWAVSSSHRSRSHARKSVFSVRRSSPSSVTLPSGQSRDCCTFAAARACPAGSSSITARSTCGLWATFGAGAPPPLLPKSTTPPKSASRRRCRRSSARRPLAASPSRRSPELSAPPCGNETPERRSSVMVWLSDATAPEPETAWAARTHGPTHRCLCSRSPLRVAAVAVLATPVDVGAETGESMPEPHELGAGRPHRCLVGVVVQPDVGVQPARTDRAVALEQQGRGAMGGHHGVAHDRCLVQLELQQQLRRPVPEGVVVAEVVAGDPHAVHLATAGAVAAEGDTDVRTAADPVVAHADGVGAAA